MNRLSILPPDYEGKHKVNSWLKTLEEMQVSCSIIFSIDLVTTNAHLQDFIFVLFLAPSTLLFTTTKTTTTGVRRVGRVSSATTAVRLGILL